MTKTQARIGYKHYTPEQVAAGVALKRLGKTNIEIARIVGVRSPYYFGQRVKRAMREEA